VCIYVCMSECNVCMYFLCKYVRVFVLAYLSIYACICNLCVLMYVCMYGRIGGLFYKCAHVCMCVSMYV
jgi:hypothetical protein